MKYLVTYYSNTGHTKKVVDLLSEKLGELGEVKVKNVLTTTSEQLDWADFVIIGSPIHGYFFFGQNLCSQVKNFIQQLVPDKIENKKFIIFVTYLFSYGKALKKMEKVIKDKNGIYLGSFAEKRNNTHKLADQIYLNLE